jgi:hypothetical protein
MSRFALLLTKSSQRTLNSINVSPNYEFAGWLEAHVLSVPALD